MQYGFVIDHKAASAATRARSRARRRTTCRSGVSAPGSSTSSKGAFPDVKRLFSCMRCNHCTNAPCVTICPVNALEKRKDGIVDLDRDACIGCRACMQACPYDAIYLNEDLGAAEKCHFCAHRVEKGLEPACVIVCPSRRSSRATCTIRTARSARWSPSTRRCSGASSRRPDPTSTTSASSRSRCTPALQGNMSVLAIGFVVSFITAILAIKSFLGYIKKRDFSAFGWYRIVLAIVYLPCLRPLTHVEARRSTARPPVELASCSSCRVSSCLRSVGSTLDVAHAIARGGAGGTLVLADEQTAGRGRHGPSLDVGAAAPGIWLTLIERPDRRARARRAVAALRPVRAPALDALAGATIGVKWPNDLYVGGRKLAGILIETRWRGTRPTGWRSGSDSTSSARRSERRPASPRARTRLDALARLVPALRRAASLQRPPHATTSSRAGARATSPSGASHCAEPRRTRGGHRRARASCSSHDAGWHRRRCIAPARSPSRTPLPCS